MRRFLSVIMAAGFLSATIWTSADESAKPVDAGKEWNAVVDRAVDYLKKSQDENGSWSGKKTPGVTGIVLIGLLRTGKVKPDDPVAQKAIKYIESLVNEKDGHIAGKDPAMQLKNYVTSINIMALNEVDPKKYKKVIDDASAFLRKLQWDEGEEKDKKSDFYGGAGYDSKSSPDLSNTQMFLDALVAAGVPKNDPAFEKARIFVSRCQNIKGESNDQPWADKIDDGSFIYSCAGGGQSKVEGSSPEKGLQGHGALTYGGIKSLIYCDVAKDDIRVKKAFEWIRKNYTVDSHPGMKPGTQTLYYYYFSMAKCLSVYGIDEVEDAKGVKHDWRADIRQALKKRQKDDGQWVNETDRWMEGDPNLVTGYSLIALSYATPKK